ncbi:MAG: response regulator transcription factor [Lachnospiraceae bacterium]|nr:response regulator transcription factor [Lachnospiraceae bacterium]MBP5299098.1 response regulator transcription factor [Lachnospiraceae bacterium]
MDLEGGYKEFARTILRLSDGYKESKEKILNAYNDVDESYSLTEREWEVAKLAASRYTNKEIADELMLSDYTVKNHLKNIFDKVGIKGNDKNKRIILAEKLRLNK